MDEYEVALGPPSLAFPPPGGRGSPLVVPEFQNALQARSVPNSSQRRARNQDHFVRRDGSVAVYRGAGCGTIPSAESAKVHSACTSGTSGLASAGHLFGHAPFRRLQSRSGIPSTELTYTLVPGTILPRSPRAACASGRGGVSISCLGSPRILFHGRTKCGRIRVAATTFEVSGLLFNIQFQLPYGRLRERDL